MPLARLSRGSKAPKRTIPPAPCRSPPLPDGAVPMEDAVVRELAQNARRTDGAAGFRTAEAEAAHLRREVYELEVLHRDMFLYRAR